MATRKEPRSNGTGITSTGGDWNRVTTPSMVSCTTSLTRRHAPRRAILDTQAVRLNNISSMGSLNDLSQQQIHVLYFSIEGGCLCGTDLSDNASQQRQRTNDDWVSSW